ncbi:hypothetical protein MSTE_03480 [Mycobacteroides stephanolepidis]|uniref:Uncharacterized protein n=1 Tax=[Mycobacterium] stephanolepidis TaxID=1520670 RepID=A0A1Z4F0N7_9MYCO|nr:hypothetical protein MSTE_03480 [[Mycobacterium] stephanolepidis]
MHGFLAWVYPSEESFHAGRKVRSKSRKLAIVDNKRNTFTINDISQLWAAEARVHQHQAGSGLARSEHGQHKAAMVATQHCDNSAIADTSTA